MSDQRGRLVGAVLCAVVGRAARDGAWGAVAKGARRGSPCGEAGSQCATAKVPRDYDQPERRQARASTSRSRRPPAPASGSARCSSTSAAPARSPPRTSSSSAPTCSRCSMSASTSSAWTRAAPASTSTPRTPLLQDRPGDRRDLLDAVHDAVQPRRAAQLVKKVSALRLALHQEQRAEPAPARVDGRRRARHGDHARGGRRRQADLPWLLLRDVPGLHLREPVPGQDARAGAGRGARRQAVHQPPDAGPARADERAVERAIGRFFQACATRSAACSGFGGDDPWLAFDELDRPAPTRRRSRRPATRPIRARSRATTCSPRPSQRSTRS